MGYSKSVDEKGEDLLSGTQVFSFGIGTGSGAGASYSVTNTVPLWLNKKK